MTTKTGLHCTENAIPLGYCTVLEQEHQTQTNRPKADEPIRQVQVEKQRRNDRDSESHSGES